MNQEISYFDLDQPDILFMIDRAADNLGIPYSYPHPSGPYRTIWYSKRE